MRPTKRDTHPITPQVTAPPLVLAGPEQRPAAPSPVEALVQLAPDAMVVVDSAGRIRVVNHLTEELFGYAAADLLGQSVEMLVPERLRGFHKQHRADYSAAPHVRPFGTGLPLSGRRQDGSEFPLQASLAPLAEGDEALVIVCIHDMSELQEVHDAQVVTQAAYQDLHALQALTDIALSHLALEDLLPALLQRVTEVLGVDNAGVLLLDPSGQTLTVQTAYKLDKPVSTRLQVPIGEGIVGQIAGTREPLVVDDIATYPIAVPLFRGHFQSAAGVPLKVGDQLLGVILVGTMRLRHFTARDVQLLQQAADRMALAIDRASLYTAEQQARAMAESARAEAEQQAAQLAAIFEAMADGVVVFDADGCLVRENAAQQHLEGRHTATPNFAGLPFPERLALFSARDKHGRPLGVDEGPLPRALHGEILCGAETMDIRSRTLDGREVELSVSAAPLRDREGQVTGAVAIFRDQTEQKRLERDQAEQAEQLDRLFDSIADGLVLHNIGRQLLRLNGEARRILGLDAAPAEYAQLAVDDRLRLYEAYDERGHRIGIEDWPAARVLRGQVNGADAREIRLRAFDGREVDLYVRAEPLRDEVGRLTGVVTVLHDQSEQKRLASEREDAHARELAAQEVAQQVRAFLATAAHDIRTPLTVAAAQVHMARRRAKRLAAAVIAPPPAPSGTPELPTRLIDGVAESLESAQGGMDRLRRLVKVLFDVTKAQSLALELASCELTALMQRNVAAQQRAARGRRIGVEVPKEEVLVNADADRLDEVLSNLLSNALKYSPADQPVTVRLEVVRNEAVVSVQDHGPGLPPEEQRRVWEIYHRVPGVEVQSGSDEASGSLGLGLHICKQLIDRHPGGRIGVDSTVGQGSTFWFRLPLARAI